jgi:hypothetical protein
MKTSTKTTLVFGMALGLAFGLAVQQVPLASRLFAATPKLKTDHAPISADARPAFTFGPGARAAAAS